MEGFRRAAEQGDASAQYLVGGMYADGEGVDQNVAISWFAKAAERGDLSAQLSLGRIYTYEQFARTNGAQAIKWYTMAADQGDPEGKRALGLIYSEDVLAKRDMQRAVYWFQKAAEQQVAPSVVSSLAESPVPVKTLPPLKNWISPQEMITNPDLVVRVSIHLTNEGEIEGIPDVTGSGGTAIVLNEAMEGARLAVIAAASYKFPPDKYDISGRTLISPSMQIPGTSTVSCHWRVSSFPKRSARCGRSRNRIQIRGKAGTINVTASC